MLGVSLAKVEMLAIGLEHVFPLLPEVLMCWGTLYGGYFCGNTGK